jgi:hypothetical protein
LEVGDIWVIVCTEDDMHVRDIGGEHSLRKPFRMGHGFLGIIELEAEQLEIVSIEEIREVLSDTVDFECTVRTQKVSLEGRERTDPSVGSIFPVVNQVGEVDWEWGDSGGLLCDAVA